MVSPMLSCEDAFLLASWVLAHDPKAELGVGPVPVHGQDKTFPGGFTMHAEKAPNARGVRRVLEALAAGRPVHDAAAFEKAVASGVIGTAVVTGNYPSDWVSNGLAEALRKVPFMLVDTLPTALPGMGQGVLPQFVGNDPLSAAMVRALMGRPRRSRPPAPISASTSGAR